MRKTVMIGAMKPMTAGHYKLITEAVADSQVPAGEIPANETYVLISVQDRIKKGELPISGEAALTAMRDIYLPSTDIFKFDNNKFIHLVFCYSERFSSDSPERVAEIRQIVNDISNVLASKGATNITTNIEVVQSGPPNYLLTLAENNPGDEFILYTGQDDLRKHTYLNDYVDNISFAGFERFEAGVSGTETRGLMQKAELNDEDEARFKSTIPAGVDPEVVRQHYRKSAGLQTETVDTDDLILGTEEYQSYIDEIIERLLGVKSSLKTRKKTGKYYRKEAAACQTAISSLKHLKRKSERELLKNSNILNEVYEGKLDVKFVKNTNIDRESIRNFLKFLKK